MWAETFRVLLTRLATFPHEVEVDGHKVGIMRVHVFLSKPSCGVIWACYLERDGGYRWNVLHISNDATPPDLVGPRLPGDSRGGCVAELDSVIPIAHTIKCFAPLVAGGGRNAVAVYCTVPGYALWEECALTPEQVSPLLYKASHAILASTGVAHQPGVMDVCGMIE